VGRTFAGIAVALGLGIVAGASPALAQTVPPPNAATPITLYLGLVRPEAAARAAWARVGDPTSSAYRRFATPGQSARRFGASRDTIRGVRAAAAALGMTATVDPSGVFARVRAPLGVMQRVFHVEFQQQFDNDVFAETYFLSPRSRLRVPARLKRYVRETVTTYARSTREPAVETALPAARRPRNAGTWTDGCRRARGLGTYSFAQARTAYGLDAVGSGAGARLGIFNLGESASAGDVRANARCFGLPGARTHTVLTDGQRAPFSFGTPEPQEDLALIRGMAPGARSLTFVQAWPANDLWFLGFSEALAATPRLDVFSVSYGQCERLMTGPGAPLSTQAGAAIAESLIVRLGLTGVSTFAAAGDFGSSCNGLRFRGAAWPASSPYITAVGGSRLVLNPDNTRAGEVVWNDLPWLTADNGGGAGGGGASLFSARPGYQRAVPVAGRRRLLPDLAAHASMLPGWPVSFAGNWIVDAGTSAAAPLVAGAFATLSARERAAGRPPLGPVNGMLYRLETTDPAAFHDIVSGQNRWRPHVPGYRAQPGYDRASGLGAPRFDRIAAALPDPG